MLLDIAQLIKDFDMSIAKGACRFVPVEGSQEWKCLTHDVHVRTYLQWLAHLGGR